MFVVEEVGPLQGNRNIDSSISCPSQAYSLLSHHSHSRVSNKHTDLSGSVNREPMFVKQIYV